MKDRNIRPETIKLLEEKIGNKVLDTGLENYFLDLIPKAQAKKAKVNKCTYIKLRSLCTAKEQFNIIKRQPTE